MMKKSDGKSEYAKESVSDNSLKAIKDDKSFQILKLALAELKEKYNLDNHAILNLIVEKPVPKEIVIPISLFEYEQLSALEIICKYLKEELDLTYSKIGVLLNRDSRTIWATYNNASEKLKEKLHAKETRFFIPISVLKNRRFSVLESIICYLKEKFGLRYNEISKLLNRDERNIWAIHNRALKKKK